MPFVFDRFCVEYCIIDENTQIDDPIRFVKVKRVHLKLNTKCSEALNPSDFNVDQIQRCLCKFGKISSIELLGREKSEAHVTFENDTSAYLLWMHYRFGKKLKEEPIFDVKPAVNVKLTYIIDTPNKRR